jgi:hypothetical protein
MRDITTLQALHRHMSCHRLGERHRHPSCQAGGPDLGGTPCANLAPPRRPASHHCPRRPAGRGRGDHAARARTHAPARLVSPVGWASLAGFWQLSKIWHAKPEILSIFVLIKYPLKFLQISKIYINLYKIQKNTKYFFINPLE